MKTTAMMLPLSLLNAAQNKPMLAELKNGETFNGHLVACDNFMNLTLRDVYQTSASGTQFWKLTECYIRGSTIKYCRVADSVIDQVKEAEEQARKQRQSGGGGLSGGVGLGVRGGGGGQHGNGGRGGRGGHQQSWNRGAGGRGGGGQRGGSRGRGM
ncbi:Sm-like ribonucleo protein [Violaceomyces palustris]|uniref:Sm-like ribonucleo protein n=1 Tax=Violaceomyces palustris TaxID=1673888 RepID=A0ACD0NYY5_9BASI|nr:Sm-like ribonucleo protein [Violaceomyces palustris]